VNSIQDLADSLNISFPSPVSALTPVISGLQLMTALGSTVSDSTAGSQIRTLLSVIGVLLEQQNVSTTLQSQTNSILAAFSLFGITPAPPATASGTVVFSLSTPATSDIPLGVGIGVATTGGILFTTTEPGTLSAGNTSVSLTVSAQNPGNSGNVPAGAITEITSSLPYPLSVNNPAPTSGGSNAESVSSALSRMDTYLASLPACTPVAIANGVIGIATPSGETCKYATTYEPWIAQVQAGKTTGFTVGYTVYIDNGSGTASAPLIAQVQSTIEGTPGAGPAGVPFSVEAVTPLPINVTISATSVPTFNAAIPEITTLAQNAATEYFTQLNFGDPVEISQLFVAVGNAVYGFVTGLNITLSPDQNVITVPPTQRAILNSLVIQIVNG
jgi:uncharacterized phage protein gp47/JayE